MNKKHNDLVIHDQRRNGLWHWPATVIGVAAACFLTGSTAQAQVNPLDYGRVVNGYQEQFDGAVLSTNWQVVNAGTVQNVYTLNGKGVLDVKTTDGDPNHLLLVIPGYSLSNQEVLARFRVISFGTGDGPRGGIGLAVTATAGGNFSRGIDLQFRDYSEASLTGKHLRFLDDLRSWGNALDYKWEPGVWIWMRLAHTNTTGTPHAYGKVWLADGLTPEPADWTVTWDYTSTPARSGYAGLTAGSANGTANFQCDYFLLKAVGLPQITVAPTAPPPEIAQVLPVNLSSYLPPSTTLSFVARSTAGITPAGVKVEINGEDISSQLVITGTPNARTVVYNGPFAASKFYNVMITITDSTGGSSVQPLLFDTILDTNFTIEAENFNFSNGQFIDNPVLASLPAASNYIDRVGVANVDEFNPTEGGATHLYRGYTNGVGESVGTEITGDILRSGYLTAQAVDPGIVDYNLSYVDAFEWWNYTRTIPTNTYNVLARMASPNATIRARLDKVLTDPTVANQTTSTLGMFATSSTGDWQKYAFIPLTDAYGNQVAVRLGGKTTLRVMALNGFNANFFMFAPTTVTGTLLPYLATASPAPGATGVNPEGRVDLAIADRDTKVVASSVKLFLNSNDVTSASTVQRNDAGATVSYLTPAFLPAGSANTVTVTYSDDATPANKFTNTYVFNVTTTARIIPARYALPENSADTANPGFTARFSQQRNDAANTTARTENQLAGRLLPLVTQGFDTPKTINYWGNGGHPAGLPDTGVPNFPGVIDGTYRDNVAMEAITYIPLKKGAYTWGLQSDDGYRLTTGTNAQDIGLVLGELNGGGGVAWRDFSFLVETNGLYPFRLSWEQGGGGYMVYLYSVDANGIRTLINDSTNGNTFKAYRYSTVVPASTVTVTRQPTNITLAAYTPLRLSVRPSAYGGSITNPYVFFIQWQKNGVDVPGAYGADLNLQWPTTADFGEWRARITLGGVPDVLSQTATVTVTPDTTAPTVVSSHSGRTLDQVVVSFNKPISPDSLNFATFSFSPTLFVSAVSLFNDTNVVLMTSEQAPGLSYTVTINGITDRSGNALPADTKSKFTGYILTPGIAVIEFFDNIGNGTTVPNLINAAKFIANTPDRLLFNTLLETPGFAFGDNYGARLSAVLTAPVTGDYTFFVASDDSSELDLSTDNNPANATMIASLSGATGQHTWSANVSQKSAPVTLTAGSQYYIRVLYKEGGGGDGCSVGWIVPNATTGTNIVVVPGSVLSSYVNPDLASITITNQPVSVTTLENRYVTFSVNATGASEFGTAVVYQWQKNGVNIAGATSATYTYLAPLADSNATFTCVVTVPTLSKTTSPAVLTVNQDINPPNIVIAGSTQLTNVTVVFDELISASTATNATRYTVTGATVTNAILNGNRMQVLLQLTSGISAGATVKVTGIEDLAGNPVTAVAPVVIVANQVAWNDPVVGTSLNTPAAEFVANAIDGTNTTKYLNYDKLNTGLTVTPAVGSTMLNGIALTSANDTPARDPISYIISGSNDGTNFTTVASGTVGTFSARFTLQEFYFTNTAVYKVYQVIFPTVADPVAANSMQIADVGLLGTVVSAGTSVKLVAVKSGSNVVISWPAASGSLYSVGALPAATADWQKVTSPAPVVANGTSTVTIPFGTGKTFYIVK